MEWPDLDHGQSINVQSAHFNLGYKLTHSAGLDTVIDNRACRRGANRMALPRRGYHPNTISPRPSPWSADVE